MANEGEKSRTNVAALNKREEDSRSIAIAANAVNLRLVDVGSPNWGSNEALAFLNILRSLNSLNAGIESKMEGESLAPKVSEQAINKQLEDAARALQPAPDAPEPGGMVDEDRRIRAVV